MNSAVTVIIIAAVSAAAVLISVKFKIPAAAVLMYALAAVMFFVAGALFGASAWREISIGAGAVGIAAAVLATVVLIKNKARRSDE